MADDAQFDPFAGVMTPQMLALARMQQMQQLSQQAGASGLSGRDFGARMAGLSIGQALGQAGTGNGPMDRYAAENAQSLQAGGPQQSAGGPGGGSMLEQQAQRMDMIAQQLQQRGMYQQAQQFTDKANLLRKQQSDLLKSSAETYEAQGKGAAAFSDIQKTPIVEKADTATGWGYARPTPDGSVPVVGSDGKRIAAPPPQGPMNVQVSYDKAGNQALVNIVQKKYAEAQDALTSLQLNNQMQSYLDKGILSGTAAQQRLGLQTFWKTLGFDNGKPDVENTQAYAQLAVNAALGNRPPGTRLTEKEWQWLNSAAGGNVEMNDTTLKRIAADQRQILEWRIDEYNRVRDTFESQAKDMRLKPEERAGALYNSTAFQRIDKSQAAYTPPAPTDPAKDPAVLKARAAADAALRDPKSPYYIAPK